MPTKSQLIRAKQAEADKVMFEPLGALLASGQEKDEAEEKDEKTPDAQWRLVVATTLAEEFTPLHSRPASGDWRLERL